LDAIGFYFQKNVAYISNNMLKQYLFHSIFAEIFWLILFLSFPSSLFLLSKIKSQINSKVYYVIEYIIFSTPLILYIYYTFPGIYLPDTVSQLMQASNGVYNDWHPPLLSAFMAILINSFDTPTSLYWLLACLFLVGWTAFFIVFKINSLSFFSIYFLSICFALVGLTLFGVILKDIFVAYSLFAATGLLTLFIALHNRAGYALLPVCILISLAIISRHNALPAVLPILFILFYRCFSKNRFSALWSMLLVVAFCISLHIFLKTITYESLEAQKWNIRHSIMLHDLAYYENKYNTNIIPEKYRRESYSRYNLSESLTKLNCDFIMANRINPNAPYKVLRGSEDKTIDNLWFSTILKNPFPYVWHRLLVFANFLSLGNNKPWHFYYPSGNSDILLEKNDIIVEKRFPKSIIVEHMISKSLSLVARIFPIYLGWFWLLINVGLVFLAAYKLNKSVYAQLAFVISLSGLVYFMFYVIIAPCPSFRYFYWPILACISSLFLLQISTPKNA
jgi:hypothetical protein